MPSKLASHRKSAFDRQAGRCYYCGYRMWLKRPEELAALAPLSNRTAAHLQCTAEHLIARCDGGSESATNIVAACRFCNQLRHQRKTPIDPSRFRSHVGDRLARRAWHTSAIWRAFVT